MPETFNASKPAWVKALDEAQDALRSVGSTDTAEESASKVQLAYAWMDISKLLKD